MRTFNQWANKWAREEGQRHKQLLDFQRAYANRLEEVWRAESCPTKSQFMIIKLLTVKRETQRHEAVMRRKIRLFKERKERESEERFARNFNNADQIIEGVIIPPWSDDEEMRMEIGNPEPHRNQTSETSSTTTFSLESSSESASDSDIEIVFEKRAIEVITLD